jgi:hypothetical protein
VLCLHLVNTGIDVDHHAPRRRRDQSFADTDQVVQPAVALVIRLEPADKVLPARLVAFKDRSPAKLDEDGRAIWVVIRRRRFGSTRPSVRRRG